MYSDYNYRWLMRAHRHRQPNKKTSFIHVCGTYASESSVQKTAVTATKKLP